MAQQVQNKPTIVLIHGLWMTSASWEDWINFYANRGYTVIAPNWPGLDDRTVEEIRSDPKALEGLHIGTIVDHYAEIIKALPTPPIIIGHSFGGLFTQVLLSRGFGAAGIGICPAQPAGILALKPSTIKAGFSIFSNPLNYNRAVPLGASDFHYAFGNHLNVEDSNKLWEKFSIPGAGHVLWQAALGLVGGGGGEGKVDWDKKDRAPMLLVAGTKDHLVPESIVESVVKKYSGGLVEMKIIDGKTHGIVMQEGWQEVAELLIEWAESKIKA